MRRALPWESHPVEVRVQPGPGFGSEPDYDTGDLRDRAGVVAWLVDELRQSTVAAGMALCSLRSQLSEHPDERVAGALGCLEAHLRRIDAVATVARSQPQRRFELNELARQRLGLPDDVAGR